MISGVKPKGQGQRNQKIGGVGVTKSWYTLVGGTDSERRKYY